LRDMDNPDMRGFRITEGKVTEVELDLT